MVPRVPQQPLLNQPHTPGTPRERGPIYLVKSAAASRSADISSACCSGVRAITAYSVFGPSHAASYFDCWNQGRSFF